MRRVVGSECCHRRIGQCIGQPGAAPPWPCPAAQRVMLGNNCMGVARIVRNEDGGLVGCGVWQAARSGKRWGAVSRMQCFSVLWHCVSLELRPGWCPPRSGVRWRARQPLPPAGWCMPQRGRERRPVRPPAVAAGRAPAFHQSARESTGHRRAAPPVRGRGSGCRKGRVGGGQRRR